VVRTHAFGGFAQRAALFGVLTLEHDVLAVEHRPGHVPVDILGFQAQREATGVKT
jgi:hypothetical protein